MGDDLSKHEILDDTSYSTENEDELADKLLTQFPVYGSAEHSTDDWLSGEEDGENGLLEDEVFAKETTGVRARAEATSPTCTSVGAANNNTLDWDEEEQGLWKKKEGNASNNGGGVAAQRRVLASSSTPSTIPTSLAGITFYSLSGQLMASPTTATTTASDDQQQQTVGESNDDRQHWMPDKLCKQCYACEQPFTGT